MMKQPKGLYIGIAVIAILASSLGVMTVLAGHHPPKSKPIPRRTTATLLPTNSSPSNSVTNIYDYPASRFQEGRPSAVTGLKAISIDDLTKTINLSWNPNPVNEGVDQYALYYFSNNYLYPRGDREGILAAVVKTPFITSQLVATESAGVLGFQPYGANYLPTCKIPDSSCEIGNLQIWVIAHNNNGWGDNDPATPNPDENPNDFSELSFDQMGRVRAPQTTSIDFSTLDPNLGSGEWPNYSKEVDINSLGSTAPNSQWTIPWAPEVDVPPSRFQTGRPSDVSHVRLVSLSEKQKSIELSWDPNPTAEQVDEYAVYLHISPCPDDFCYPAFVGVAKGTSIKAALELSLTVNAPPGVAQVHRGWPATFWVIAHNKQGWGNNNPYAANPDQSDSSFRYLTKTQQEMYPATYQSLDVNIP